MLSSLASASADGSHTGYVLLALAVMLLAAKLAGHLALRLGQPAVLGELAGGILVGNLDVIGIGGVAFLRGDAFLGLLAEVGVILLLFEVGLGSTVREMARVGGTALVVATLGVVAPFGLGWGASALLLPAASIYVHVFIGAALTATSVGITARVLQELGRAQTPEARVILGAAVIDDVLGLVVLAAVAGVIGAAGGGRSMSALEIALIVGKAAAFLVGAVLLGAFLSPRMFRAAFKLRGEGLMLVAALVICFLFSAAAALMGLAPIVGAFAAGLVLEPVHWKRVAASPSAAGHEHDHEHELEELLAPVTTFLVPLFFVRMGMQVRLADFLDGRVLLLGGALTVAAILGKQACALGVPRRLDRLSVGIGMIPRGEVGLIFANIGLTLKIGDAPIVDQGIFTAIVIMVMLTTLAAPFGLKWSLARRTSRGGRPLAG